MTGFSEGREGDAEGGGTLRKVEGNLIIAEREIKARLRKEDIEGDMQYAATERHS